MPALPGLERFGDNSKASQFFETEKDKESKKNYFWHRKNTSTCLPLFHMRR